MAKSQDLASALTLMGSVVALMFLGRSVVDYLGQLAHRQLGGQVWLAADRDFAVRQSHLLLRELGLVILPIFGIMLVLAVGVHIGQIGIVFVPQKLLPDLQRIDPMKGLQRIFSLSNLVRLLLGILKVFVVGAVGAWCIWSQRETILGLCALELPPSALLIVRLTLSTCLWIGTALLVLALLDFTYQRWKHEQDLRMTAQEVREEMKTLQGDPQVLARRRGVQRQLVANRLQSSVPQADVVITNPTELAVAVKYDPEKMAAPVVVAKGAGVLARRIRELALQHEIPVVERKPLAQALYKKVDLQQPIPVQQYAAVAEVLRFVYQLKGKKLPGTQQAG